MNTLNNLKNQFGQVLSREELKGLVGGELEGIGGNVFCEIGGKTLPCVMNDLDWCEIACRTQEAGIHGGPCGGCWQFPSNEV